MFLLDENSSGITRGCAEVVYHGKDVYHVCMIW